MSHKTIRTANMEGSYGPEQTRVEQITRGRHKGRFVVRGYMYAGRIAYASADVAARTVENNRMFRGWAA